MYVCMYVCMYVSCMYVCMYVSCSSFPSLEQTFVSYKNVIQQFSLQFISCEYGEGCSPFMYMSRKLCAVDAVEMDTVFSTCYLCQVVRK
jgi:hypothetical protein